MTARPGDAGLSLAADFSEFDRLEETFLESFAWRVDVDCVPTAGLLTQTAAGALLLDDAGDTEEVTYALAGHI